MIAEISTAIDEKNRVKETLSESVRKQEKESVREIGRIHEYSRDVVLGTTTYDGLTDRWTG